MSKTIKLYRLTEWPLVWRNLAIAGVVLLIALVLWLFVSLQWQWCPGRIDCSTAPKHSLRNLL
jgi:hypothetical protein